MPHSSSSLPGSQLQSRSHPYPSPSPSIAAVLPSNMHTPAYLLPVPWNHDTPELPSFMLSQFSNSPSNRPNGLSFQQKESRPAALMPSSLGAPVESPSTCNNGSSPQQQELCPAFPLMPPSLVAAVGSPSNRPGFLPQQGSRYPTPMPCAHGGPVGTPSHHPVGLLPQGSLPPTYPLMPSSYGSPPNHPVGFPPQGLRPAAFSLLPSSNGSPSIRPGGLPTEQESRPPANTQIPLASSWIPAESPSSRTVGVPSPQRSCPPFPPQIPQMASFEAPVESPSDRYGVPTQQSQFPKYRANPVGHSANHDGRPFQLWSHPRTQRIKPSSEYDAFVELPSSRPPARPVHPPTHAPTSDPYFPNPIFLPPPALSRRRVSTRSTLSAATSFPEKGPARLSSFPDSVATTTSTRPRQTRQINDLANGSLPGSVRVR